MAFLVAQTVKNPPAMWETWVRSLGWEDPLEEEIATHSSILAWRISTDRGAWRAVVHRVAELDTTEVTWHTYSTMSSRFIHVVANDKVHFFSWLNNILLCVCVCVCLASVVQIFSYKVSYGALAHTLATLVNNTALCI